MTVFPQSGEVRGALFGGCYWVLMRSWGREPALPFFGSALVLAPIRPHGSSLADTLYRRPLFRCNEWSTS